MKSSKTGSKTAHLRISPHFFTHPRSPSLLPGAPTALGYARVAITLQEKVAVLDGESFPSVRVAPRLTSTNRGAILKTHPTIKNLSQTLYFTQKQKLGILGNLIERLRSLLRDSRGSCAILFGRPNLQGGMTNKLSDSYQVLISKEEYELRVIRKPEVQRSDIRRQLDQTYLSHLFAFLFLIFTGERYASQPPLKESYRRNKVGFPHEESPPTSISAKPPEYFSRLGCQDGKTKHRSAPNRKSRTKNRA